MRKLASSFLSLCSLLLLFVLPGNSTMVVGSCSGCEGTGGDGSSSGGSCGSGAMVSVSVMVDSGDCVEIHPHPGEVDCIPVDCQVSVTRSWSGLPSGTKMNFCASAGGDTVCLFPQPKTGSSGGGSDTRQSPLNCGDTVNYSISHAGCSLTASAPGSCSDCEET